MPVNRHFLGYDTPQIHAVCRFLLPDRIAAPPEMDSTLLVVPTRRAGRRISEHLAAACEEQGTGLFPPSLRLPSELVRLDTSLAASPALVLAAWVQVLRNADLSRLAALFPDRPPDQGSSWALYVADVIQRLRGELAEGGFLIRDIVSTFAEELSELHRWRNLASLEAAYLSLMDRTGFTDPCDAMVAAALAPVIPPGISRIVVAGVPDLAPIVGRLLSRLSENHSIDLLIHAPESLAHLFDAWGRPNPGDWSTGILEIPEASRTIRLAANEAAQAGAVVRLLDESDPERTVAIGVPDANILSPLRDALERSGYTPFDPTGRAFRDHALYHLLEAWSGLVSVGDYASLSRWMRHPFFLRYSGNRDVCVASALEQLDTLQNRHLPSDLQAVIRALDQHEEYCRESGRENEFPDLARSIGLIRERIRAFEQGSGTDSLREFLREIFQDIDPMPDSAGAQLFSDAAELVVSGLRDVSVAEQSGLLQPGNDGLRLLIHCLKDAEMFARRADEELVLEGWLEVPWSDAECLILAGMNDEVVPSGFRGDPFLPESLRSMLGLKHGEERLARDAFLLAGLIASRPVPGGVTILYGKTTRSGDPLKPSRLLLRCRDEELPARATQLFGEAEVAREDVPPSVSFPLNILAARDAGASDPPDLVHVTAFAAYLGCPFRYYLSRVLGMDELDDSKVELDARDFGILVHHALEQMGRSEELRISADAAAVGEFLAESAERFAYGRYGSDLPLSVEIQLRSATERLRVAAQVHVSELSEGWEILDVERRVEGEIEGLTVVGKIDRIDRHRETGAFRLLDYKSSETADPAAKAHIGGRDPESRPYAAVTLDTRQGTWRSLQLPLYRMLLEQEGFGEGVGIGYFNLPKAVMETGVSMWEGFDEKLLDRAAHCARGVIRDIRSGRYWPPRESVKYDDFERLFPAACEECVDPASREMLTPRKEGGAV